MSYQAKRQVYRTTWPCRPEQGRPQVKGIGVERLEGVNLVCAPQPGTDCLGHGKVVLGMLMPDLGLLRKQCETVPSKFADPLQHGHSFLPPLVAVAT